jgi:hypothetical protein
MDEFGAHPSRRSRDNNRSIGSHLQFSVKGENTRRSIRMNRSKNDPSQVSDGHLGFVSMA